MGRLQVLETSPALDTEHFIYPPSGFPRKEISSADNPKMGFLTSALEMYHLFALWENDAHGYGSICGLPNIKYSIKLLV